MREYQLYENTGGIYSDDDSDHDSDHDSDDNSNVGRDYPESDDDSDTEVLEITLRDGTAVPFIDPEGEGEGERASTEDPGEDAGATAGTKCNKEFECTECTIAAVACARSVCAMAVRQTPGPIVEDLLPKNREIMSCAYAIAQCASTGYMHERDRRHPGTALGMSFAASAPESRATCWNVRHR